MLQSGCETSHLEMTKLISHFVKGQNFQSFHEMTILTLDKTAIFSEQTFSSHHKNKEYNT